MSKHSLSSKLMKTLSKYTCNILKSHEIREHELKFHSFQNDTFHQIKDDKSIDKWWKEVENSSKHTLLSRLAFGLLTCFHEPLLYFYICMIIKQMIILFIYIKDRN